MYSRSSNTSIVSSQSQEFFYLYSFDYWRFWLSDVHCSKSELKCVKYYWISDLWPCCFFTLTVWVTDRWSCTSVPMLVGVMYTEYFLLLFTGLLLKLQYEIQISCQIKKRRGARGCQPFVLMHLSLFSHSNQSWRDVPIKHGKPEHRTLFCTLWFVCEIIGILLASGAVPPQSIRNLPFFFFFFQSKSHQSSETLNYDVIFSC